VPPGPVVGNTAAVAAPPEFPRPGLFAGLLVHAAMQHTAIMETQSIAMFLERMRSG